MPRILTQSWNSSLTGVRSENAIVLGEAAELDLPMATCRNVGQSLLFVQLTRNGIGIRVAEEKMDSILTGGFEDGDYHFVLLHKSPIFVLRNGFGIVLRHYRKGISGYAMLTDWGAAPISPYRKVLGRVFHINSNGTLYLPEARGVLFPPIRLLSQQTDNFSRPEPTQSEVQELARRLVNKYRTSARVRTHEPYGWSGSTIIPQPTPPEENVKITAGLSTSDTWQFEDDWEDYPPEVSRPEEGDSLLGEGDSLPGDFYPPSRLKNKREGF